jgi:hypothetical protein
MSLLLRSSPWLTSTTLEYPYLIAGREIGPPTTDLDRRPYHQERAVLTASHSPTAPIQPIETEATPVWIGWTIKRVQELSTVARRLFLSSAPILARPLTLHVQPGGQKKDRGLS